MTTRAPAILAAAVITCLPFRSAQAQSTACTTTNCGTEAMNLRGFEGNLNVGVGGQINDSSSAFRNLPNAGNRMFWLGFGAHLNLGYRFASWGSVGVHAMYQNNTTRDLLPNTVSSSANAAAGGVYFRLYAGGLIPSGRLDPFVSIGVDPYAGQWAQFTTVLGSSLVTRYDTTAVPITVGADILVTRNVSLTLSGQFAPWIPWQICTYAPQGGPPTCDTNSDHMLTNVYAFGGIGGRYTSGM